VLKIFFNHLVLVNEADDAHLSLAFGTDKRVCFINFSNEGAEVKSLAGKSQKDFVLAVLAFDPGKAFS